MHATRWSVWDLEWILPTAPLSVFGTLIGIISMPVQVEYESRSQTVLWGCIPVQHPSSLSLGTVQLAGALLSFLQPETTHIYDCAPSKVKWQEDREQSCWALPFWSCDFTKWSRMFPSLRDLIPVVFCCWTHSTVATLAEELPGDRCVRGWRKGSGNCQKERSRGS